MYKLISVKGTRTIDGDLSVAIAAAAEMMDDLQPSFGVSIERGGKYLINLEDDDLIEAARVGLEVGRSIAKDAIAGGMSREWTGLDDQDGDRITAAGIEFESRAWDVAEEAAAMAFREALESR